MEENNYSGEESLRPLSPLAWVLAVMTFAAFIIPFLLIFIFWNIPAAVICFGVGFILISALIMAVRRSVSAKIPYVFMAVGLMTVIAGIILDTFGPVFIFFGVIAGGILAGINVMAVMFIVHGCKVEKLRKEYMSPEDAKIVEVVKMETGAPESNGEVLERAIVEYTVDGMTYRFDDGVFHGEKNLEAGAHKKIYVKKDNPSQAVYSVETGTLFIMMGWAFIISFDLCGIISFAVMALCI